MCGTKKNRLNIWISFWVASVHLLLPVTCASLPRGWVAAQQPGNPTGQLPRIILPLADPEEFLDRHSNILGINARNVLHIAPSDFNEVDVVSKGMWRNLPDGSSLWSLAIVSPGAQSHVLVFSELALPWAGEFSIYSPSYTANQTVCSHSCMIMPAKAQPSQRLTTTAMQGDEVILELHHPGPHPPTSGFVVRIASVMQGLEGSLPEAAELQQRRRRRQLLAKSQEVRYTPGTDFDMSLLQRKSDSVASCTPSVLCDSEWDQINDSVLDIYAVNLQLGAMALCTGTLITAPIGRKFVLTADHCFVDKKAINNFEYWILIFNYEQQCGVTEAPAIKQVIQGLKLTFYDSKADILLLEVSATIPDGFKPYKLGYNGMEDAVPKRAVGIHHPNGNFKRISYANSSGSISTNFVARKFPAGEIQPSASTHLQVIWSKGATASGSSGSPLIDIDTGKVVAVLTGGFASCSSPRQPDYYGRLSAAWKNGLEHFLSSAPPDGILEEVAEILTANNDGGSVVVRTMNSSASPKHGPGLGFFPHVLTFSPKERTKSFTYFLTDPMPFPNENILMNVTVRGSVPGNLFDMAPYINLSETSDVFTPTDLYAYKRSIEISVGLGDGQNYTIAPGNMGRFQLIFRLTSTVDPNYLHIHTLKGIAQAATGPWTQYMAVEIECDELPCMIPYPGRNDSDIGITFDEYNPDITVDDHPQLAIFSFTPDLSLNVQMDICLEDGILIGATVSIYINKLFTWTLSSDPFGDPNCLHIASIAVKGGENYTVVVSDQDSFDAVLPIRTVKYIYFADTAVGTVDPTLLLGPIAGPTAPSSATKSEHLALPADALLPDMFGPAAAPLPSATERPSEEEHSDGTVGAPIPSAAPLVLAKAPPPGQQPGTKQAAAPAAGGPAGLIRRPGQLAPDLTPSPSGTAAASRQPSGSATAGVPAPPQAPAPSAELVPWASKWGKPGQSVRSESIGLLPVSRSAAPAPSFGSVRAMPLPPAPMAAAGRIALAPSPSLGPNVQVSMSATTPAAAPAMVTPKRTAILYTSDGV
ncbi:probable lysyl endopeptidase at N-terminal half [Coccomyxa sp. Obi]|nr:probable lysyl endopeptidase at N-terminal half [Coccomyxa sp. Obi]